ncbi:MAG: RNA polymerase sigma factor [Solirubrobacterales bacterium]|nr:RNA polymerase sigma factor [Solirubrobacterales bacterium]
MAPTAGVEEVERCAPAMTTPPDPDSRPNPVDDDWSDRCARLFEEMRRPARAMVSRAYGRRLSPDEIEDIYSAAWAATLSALRERGRRMEESELRAYILTAVASHASKEMRRRSRKPAHPLEDEREQAVADGHSPLPDELAIGAEARGVARDLLTSLPERRRAVILLRYGWGLSPTEVCALVPGLSPRAYRKEITRGVEDLMKALEKVERGEWCAEREPLIRDLIAGTADESERLQALRHLDHCRACSELAARISQHLRESGSVIALAGVSTLVGGSGATFIDGFMDVLAAPRAHLAEAIDRANSAASSLMVSGGGKGSGLLSAGILGKVAGAGGAAKAALACAGAGVAATACVAVGVVPGASLPELAATVERPERAAEVRLSRPRPDGSRRAVASVVGVSRAVRREDAIPQPQDGADAGGDAPPAPVVGTPPPEVAPSAPAQEFDPVVSAAPASDPPPAPTDAPASVPPSPASSSPAQDEFGP